MVNGRKSGLTKRATTLIGILGVTILAGGLVFGQNFSAAISGFVRDTTGAVFGMAKTGGAARSLSGPNTGTASGPLDIDANASVVWWTWMDTTNSATKGLFHANADGSGFTAVETGSDLTTWSGPRVDDTAVFYFHAGALLKRLK